MTKPPVGKRYGLGVVCAALAAGCIVQGGEERDREGTLTLVGVVRYEAVNQRKETVGSGCSVDAPKYYGQIRFHAQPGDQVTLTETFLDLNTTPELVDAHREDVEYWCAQQGGLRYSQPPDASCWHSVPPVESSACFQQRGLVGTIGAVKPVPDGPLTAGEVDGFTLSIDVVGTGTQCVRLQCAPGGPGGERVAFVVE